MTDSDGYQGGMRPEDTTGEDWPSEMDGIVEQIAGLDAAIEPAVRAGHIQAAAATAARVVSINPARLDRRRLQAALYSNLGRAAAAVFVVLFTVGGLAAAQALPGRTQNAVAEVARVVGIRFPTNASTSPTTEMALLPATSAASTSTSEPASPTSTGPQAKEPIVVPTTSPTTSSTVLPNTDPCDGQGQTTTSTEQLGAQDDGEFDDGADQDTCEDDDDDDVGDDGGKDEDDAEDNGDGDGDGDDNGDKDDGGDEDQADGDDDD